MGAVLLPAPAPVSSRTTVHWDWLPGGSGMRCISVRTLCDIHN